jgi:alkyl sulfatase BDS1-like metallo-beta-lactamase superfamily hydrolase
MPESERDDAAQSRGRRHLAIVKHMTAADRSPTVAEEVLADCSVRFGRGVEMLGYLAEAKVGRGPYAHVAGSLLDAVPSTVLAVVGPAVGRLERELAGVPEGVGHG